MKLRFRLEEIRQTLNPKNQSIIDICLDFLQFNPFFRMSSFECLQCRVFDSVRDNKKEDYLRKLILKQESMRVKESKKLKIELNIDRIEAFEYENTANAKYSVDDLKKMVIDEIIYYNHKNGLKINVDKFYTTAAINTNSTNQSTCEGVRDSKSPIYN